MRCHLQVSRKLQSTLLFLRAASWCSHAPAQHWKPPIEALPVSEYGDFVALYIEFSVYRAVSSLMARILSLSLSRKEAKIVDMLEAGEQTAADSVCRLRSTAWDILGRMSGIGARRPRHDHSRGCGRTEWICRCLEEAKSGTVSMPLAAHGVASAATLCGWPTVETCDRQGSNRNGILHHQALG
ncbi:hypothetical protein CC79DRAFT_1216192 [Sarocladium strictum]